MFNLFLIKMLLNRNYEQSMKKGSTYFFVRRQEKEFRIIKYKLNKAN